MYTLKSENDFIEEANKLIDIVENEHYNDLMKVHMIASYLVDIWDMAYDKAIIEVK
jgi:hypothetical protein